MVYSTRQFVVCITLSPFSIAISSLGEERTNLSAFRTFVRFPLVWLCLFPLPLGVWEGLRFVIVALPGLFSYLLYVHNGSFVKCTCGLLVGFKPQHDQQYIVDPHATVPTK